MPCLAGYDANGRLIQANNADAKLQWFHDEAGNVVREHHHYLASKQTAVWHHRYNELNDRAGTTRPDGHTVEWLTYGSGHVHALVLDGRDVVDFERDDLHREVTRLQTNGLAQQQKYDPVGRLLAQQLSKAGSSAAEMGQGAFKYQDADRTALGKPATILRQYRYDKAGQLASIADSRRGQIDYRYDPVGRLLQATSALAAERFAFDPASNMIEPGKDESVPSRATGIRVLDNLLKEYAGTHYRYDDRGNLVERLHNGKSSEFAWDAFGRMTQAITPEGGATFAYDALGRRIAKHGEARGTSTHTLFGWDGDTLAFESTVTRGSSSTPSAARTVHYVHEKGSFVPLAQARRRGTIALKPTTDVRALMDANEGMYDSALDPLWSDDDIDVQPFEPDEVAFYQCDHLGTPQELTDHEGNVAWSAQYKAWGLAQQAIADAKGNAARSGGFTNPIRFQGQYFDEETGLHYNRYRFYDPHSGRFVSKDPIGLLGGNNLHQYAPNPNEWIDPYGLVPGYAIVRHYGDMNVNTGHYSVEVVQPRTGDRVHTHQWYNDDDSAMTIRDERKEKMLRGQPILHTENIPLKDADAAQAYQRSVIGKPDGTYDVMTNSCQTHVANVLRAGGESVPPGAGPQQKYLLRKGFKVRDPNHK